jgi:hypothetical protein
VLGANSLGFSGAFLVMAISGLLTGALILLGIRATGRPLETATEPEADRVGTSARQPARA